MVAARAVLRFPGSSSLRLRRGRAAPNPGVGMITRGIVPMLAALLIVGCAGDAETPAPGYGADRDPEGADAPSLPEGLETTSAPGFAEALEAGAVTLRVLYVPSSGFAGLDEGGRLTGVTVEILRRFGDFVEREYGIDVEVAFEREEDWATFYQRVRHSDGGVFGIGNVTITEPRRDELAFSPPYLSNIAILMTHEDVPELTSLDEASDALRGMTALIYPGTLHEERVLALRDDWIPGMETRTIRSNDELVGLVGSGDGYFGFIDVYNYWRAVEAGAPLRRHEVADDDSEEFGVIMPVNSDWAEPMEGFFEAEGGLRSTDWYRELLRTHLGEGLANLLL